MLQKYFPIILIYKDQGISRFDNLPEYIILLHPNSDIEDDAAMVSEDLTPFDCIFMGSL